MARTFDRSVVKAPALRDVGGAVPCFASGGMTRAYRCSRTSFLCELLEQGGGGADLDRMHDG